MSERLQFLAMNFLSTVNRNCAEIALDPAVRHAYLHRLATGCLVRQQAKG